MYRDMVLRILSMKFFRSDSAFSVWQVVATRRMSSAVGRPHCIGQMVQYGMLPAGSSYSSHTPSHSVLG